MFDELLNDFLVEAGENLSKLDNELVALEKNPNDLEVLKNIFRAIHTVKGTCGMFGLQRLEKVAHVAEDVLGRMRDGKVAVNPSTIGPVLEAIDVIKMILSSLEQSRKEPEGNDSPLIARLKAIFEGAHESPKATEQAEGAVSSTPNVAPVTPGPTETPGAASAVAEQTLRVRVDVLDRLMNLVGELVLTRNQLVQLVRGDDESKYMSPIQQLNRVTSGLQESVMKTRMQPIGNAWSKLPRIVRDLSVSSGKELELVMSGKETEIDRQVLQAIQDPLVHCVRNSADHGIERPEKRSAAGKPSKGTIHLEAFHEGGQMIIQIRDDGAGIDVDAVRSKAIERGLLRADSAAQLSETQIVQYIFEPGFSTAKQVTEVSGRGVGMDVVRSNITSIGGTIEILTQRGQGTTMRIAIPLTLAIISALVIRAGGEKGQIFAIPQVGVLELVRVSDANRAQIERIHGSRFFRLRDEVLPLVDLAGVLGLPQAGEDFTILVAKVGDSRVGLLVDEVFDTQEIVVKPVGRLIRDIGLFAGSTILGDGSVILILDTARIAARGAVESSRSVAMAEESRDSAPDLRLERTNFLLFTQPGSAACAVPVALVARLEEFPAEKVEFAGGKAMVQYRGGLLPLLGSGLEDRMAVTERSLVPAIIFSDGKRSMGLVVSEIQDIVEEVLAIEPNRSRPGVIGVAVIQGKATEIIDTYYYLQLAYPDWFAGTSSDALKKSSRVRHILLVDDSAFFRELLKPFLEAQGYSVSTAEDGEAGFALFERDPSIDLILSDIDMPVLDGNGFVRKVRTESQRPRVPMLALSASQGEDTRTAALAAGFDGYLVKFDQDEVLQTLGSLNGSKTGNPPNLQEVRS